MPVQCPHCQTENTDEAKFCSNCGRPLQVAQPSALGPAGPIGTEASPPTGNAAPASREQTTEYAGFWIRLLAAIIDGAILSAGTAFLIFVDPTPISGLLVGLAYGVLFVGLKGQTPGKMALELKIIRPGYDVPGIGTALMREVVGKFVSYITLLIGFIWVAFDPQKQGLHDKIAGTYVVRLVRQPQQPPIER